MESHEQIDDGHVALRGTFSCLHLDQMGGERRGGRERKTKRERERKERDFRERSSTFSLEFPAIGPSVFGETRSKVAPHGKGYTWVPVLWSFDKLQEVWIFLLLCLFFI